MTQRIVPPGSTIGVFGSGQLGRMIAIAAKRMGYRVIIFSPDKDTPAGQVSDLEIVSDYGDQAAVEAFAHAADVITLEFENIPVQTVRWASEITPVCPGESVLRVAQDRLIEKQTLADAGLPVTPFVAVHNLEDARHAADKLGMPIVLKTARDGYDGKGQVVVRNREDFPDAIARLGSDHLIAEKMIDFQREVSILVFRNEHYGTGTYPLIENRHANHILDVSICPAQGIDSLHDSARQIAHTTADCLDLLGLLCIEFFALADGKLLINEIAPRPHNSGHLTIEAFPCCQFQQLVRAVCSLPLGSVEQASPAAMVNLLGDVWADGEPDFQQALENPKIQLHLYGKAEAKPGRKMGHVTVTAADITEAAEQAVRARQALTMSKVH